MIEPARLTLDNVNGAAWEIVQLGPDARAALHAHRDAARAGRLAAACVAAAALAIGGLALYVLAREMARPR